MKKISIIIPVYNVAQYLSDTLSSIERQTFRDFEVIMVDDGSTDSSADIMESFCQADERYTALHQENKGVSAARNLALDRAAGEYIVFVDGDDLLPDTALEKMYRSMRTAGADLVIGMTQEWGIYSQAVYAGAKELAAKKNIAWYDPQIPYSFSIWGKLFRKSVIDQIHLRFEPLKHSEDALFFFGYLYHCGKITGCREIVYRYRKRPFWEERSATAELTLSYLTDLLSALDGIEEMTRERAAQEMTHAKEQDCDCLYEEQVRTDLSIYQARLHTRFIEVSLLGDFYRSIWKAQSSVVLAANEAMQRYKRKLFPRMWEEIVSEQSDLRLQDGLLSTEALVKNPLLTVAISDRVPAENVDLVIESLRNQHFPALVIFLHGMQAKHANPLLLEAENITVTDEMLTTAEFKNFCLQKAKSPYISFIDEPLYPNVNTYQHLYKCLQNNVHIPFCTCQILLLQDGAQTVSCKPHEIPFSPRTVHQNTRSLYLRIDWMMGNKLLRTASLVRGHFCFTDDPAADTARLYKKFSFLKVKNIYVFMPVTQRDILKGAKSPLVRVFWRFRALRENIHRKEWRRQITHTLKSKSGQCKKALQRTVLRLIPVQKKVLFVSIRGSQLLENAKAVYDAYEGKKVVFAKPYPYSRADLFRLYGQLFSSKVIVTDDYLKYFRDFDLKKKQKIIQIWHACGAFKKFGLDNPSGDITKERQNHRQYDTVIVSAEGVRKDYASAFGLDIQKVQALGVPRTDKLLDPAYLTDARNAFFSAHLDMAGKKILLYAPTFREVGTKRVQFDPQLNWQEVSRSLGSDVVMIIKNHPHMDYDLLYGRKYSNIVNLPAEDTSRLMIVCDALVTDYSSVVFEAAILNKPLLLYCPDYATYERDFYLDFPDDLYGIFTTCQEDFLRAVPEVLSEGEVSGLSAFKKKYVGSCDGHSTKRVVSLIQKKLREK